MKKNHACFLWIWLVILLPSHPSLASDIIWTEDFSTDENVGCAYDGTTGPGSGKWSADCTTTSFADANDYFKVASGQFEGRSLGGEAIWTSLSIDISAFKNVFFSVDISHTETALNGNDLTLIIKVNNNADVEKLEDASLSGDVTVTNILKLISGNLLLGGHDLIIASGGNIQGGSPNSYIITKDDKASGGFLRRETPNNDMEITFPVGTPESFTPCFITNASAGNSETFSVRVFNDVFENGTSGPAVDDLENLVNKTWEISPVYETGANVTLTLQWNSVDQGSMLDEDLVYIIKYRDAWKAISERQAPTENSGVYTTSVTGITEFSKFTVGGESATLPVTWLSFTATEENSSVLLSWKTATEINNKGFEIQRSSNGKEFQTIGFVQGAGNAGQIQGYTFLSSVTWN